LFLKVHNYWKEKLEEIPAQSLEAVCKQVRICIEIAVDCMETDRRKRPKMKEIVRRLKEVETKDNQSCPQINQVQTTIFFVKKKCTAFLSILWIICFIISQW
jgi:hypothetical protein